MHLTSSVNFLVIFYFSYLSYQLPDLKVKMPTGVETRPHSNLTKCPLHLTMVLVFKGNFLYSYGHICGRAICCLT